MNTEIFPDELRSQYKSSEHQLTPINGVMKQNKFTANCGKSNTQNIMTKFSMARGQFSWSLSQYETHTHTVCAVPALRLVRCMAPSLFWYKHEYKYLYHTDNHKLTTFLYLIARRKSSSIDTFQISWTEEATLLYTRVHMYIHSWLYIHLVCSIYLVWNFIRQWLCNLLH